MADKKVYIKKTGQETVAYEDQISKGTWNIPEKATEVKPPSFNIETETCKFIDNKWVVADIPEPEPPPSFPEPTQEELDKLTYADWRKWAYPDWGTQLNKIYDDGIDKWKTEMVDPVKAKYLKPKE